MDAEVVEGRTPFRPSLLAVSLVLGSFGQSALVAMVLLRPNLLSQSQVLFAFTAASALPVLFAWREAIVEGKLPVLPTGAPKHQHITGWGFIALALAVTSIVGLAAWAAASEGLDRKIQADWGIAVVFGLAILFAGAALLPGIATALEPYGVVRRISWLWAPIGFLAKPLGRLLSIFDSMLVFAVAGGAGASQKSTLIRYLMLLSTLLPCALLGYLLPAPLGLAPIAWGFLVAISMSRRWAWVEDDRDVYMLNRKYSGAHVRVGFAQDLRDEALLSFMSMFFLVPLALQQAHVWSVTSGTPLFDTQTPSPRFLDWISFYGTELAKAVPFVDWAEIYQVEGAASIEAKGAAARHVVFATRVLVDLVFLAALLQALSISARNAKQMDLFNAGLLDRLDPFVEPREFRRLVRRDGSGVWELHTAVIEEFPKYDPLRLAELSAPEHYPISIAAKALRRRDGSDDSARFHEQLAERAFQKNKNADSIDEVLTAIRMTGVPVEPDELDRVRVELNHRRSMNGLRETITRLIVSAPPGEARTAALISALSDPTARDAVAPVRRIALQALGALAREGDLTARNAVTTAASEDQSGVIRKDANAILQELP